MKELKVYGGALMNPNPPPDRPIHKRQERVVCAVYTKKELAELANINQGIIKDYWCITGNKEEIERALAKPHEIIWTGRLFPLHHKEVNGY